MSESCGDSRSELGGTMATNFVSVVIPVYCAEKSLQNLYGRISRVMDSCKYDFEIIFVEDCGRDMSWQIISQLANSDDRVRGIRMSRNYGQHNALLCGIRSARGDIVVTMDDDLQHPPEEIPKLISKLNEGYDVVYGPPVQEQHGLLRDLASRITKFALASTMGADNARNASAFRVLRTDLRNAFKEFRSPTVSIDVLLAWGTTSFSAVPVIHEPRKFGNSGYTVRKLINHALNMMTGFSIRPLQLASLIGFVLALFGFLVLAYVIFRWFIYGSVVPGFAFLASIVTFFSGAQMLSIGIIGEYLARMHFRTMERPPYFVRSHVGK